MNAALDRDGQADGHVNGLIEGEEYDRDKALAVVHGHDRVELPGLGAEDDDAAPPEIPENFTEAY